MLRRNQIIYVVGFIAVLIGAVCLVYFLKQKSNSLKSETSQVPPSVTATVDEAPNADDSEAETLFTTPFPPPLADIAFPTETIEYPSQWPPELRFSEEFSLVEAVSGELPENIATGTSSKLRFDDIPQKTQEAIESHFRQQGWELVESTQLDTGGIVILVEDPDNGQGGIIVIDNDPNNLETSIVLVTIFR